MNRLQLFPLLTIFVLAFANAANAQLRTAFQPVIDDPALPRVLLLGDSISIGYTPYVQGMLGRQANVHRAPTNCGPTTKGLENLDQWLGDKKWDVIHFNFGLHDLKYIDEQGKRVPPETGKVQVEPDQYRENLTKLVERLKQTGAKLVWCSTTAVPEGASGRIPGDSATYNAIAEEVMEQAGGGEIVINNLYAFSKPLLSDIQRKADVHFFPEGSRQLGLHVSGKLRNVLSLPTPTPSRATGYVYEDLNNNGQFDETDKPLPDVRVSNGQLIVKTNAAGKYVLPISDDEILFVIKPRGYRTPLNGEQLPQFFYVHKPNGSPGSKFAGVAPTGALPSSVDFPLYRQREPEQFKALMFGDPQPRTQEEVDYISHDIIEELIGTDASFGVTLGDIVFDDLSLFESQARMIALLGIPWYNVIGNHDLNTDAKNDHHSDESFERVFGPAYYSFDFGSVHFLVLDNVEWYVNEGDGKGTYRGGLGKRQMEFIRRDLESIPANQLVVLMMHIPLTDVADRQGLYRLIEKRPFCVSIAAHTHRHEHKLIGQEDGFMGPEPHHHIINVTVSGSWWAGQKDERGVPHTIMADGAPNGYSTLVFDGNQYKMEFKAAGRPKDYQLSIHAAEVVKSAESAESDLYVNFFNGSAKSKVEFKIGGDADDSDNWVEMRKSAEEDPYFRHIYKAEAAILAKFTEDSEKRPFTPLNNGRPSEHLWRSKLPANLPVGTHLIRARATDRHGRVYHGNRVLRVSRK